MKFMAALSIASLCCIQPAFADCQKDDLAVTKPGYYGALNPEAYGAMDNAVAQQDTAKLTELLQAGSIVSIPSGKKACIVIRASNWYRYQIAVDGLAVPYWVQEEAVSIIK